MIGRPDESPLSMLSAFTYPSVWLTLGLMSAGVVLERVELLADRLRDAGL